MFVDIIKVYISFFLPFILLIFLFSLSLSSLFSFPFLSFFFLFSSFISFFYVFIICYCYSRRCTADSMDGYRLFGPKLLCNLYPINTPTIIIDTSTLDKYKYIQKVCLTLVQISLTIFIPSTTTIQLTEELLKLLRRFVEVMFEYLKHPSILLSSLTFEFWNMILKNDNNYWKLYIYVILFFLFLLLSLLLFLFVIIIIIIVILFHQLSLKSQ